MKKNKKLQSSNDITNCNKVSSKSKNVGFNKENVRHDDDDAHSFELDENSEHSFELRD
ncbi:MAG: hypothetical protein PHE54_02635 [Bacilli bacterium]|nr:hypothetical protein [Bacilli bacterium]